MHNHRTSSCIVLHEFTAYLARKIKNIFPTSDTNRKQKVFCCQRKLLLCNWTAHTWDKLSFNNYRNVLKLAV